MVATNSPVAFGSNLERFGRITLHPGLDPNGLYREQPDGCDPCRYSPQPLNKLHQVNKNQDYDREPWRYKSELEDWARNLGFRNQKILATRRWFQSLLGPAWHEIKPVPKYEPACPNLSFGRTPRSKPYKNFIPGPGSYYKEVPFKAPYGPHSTRPSFEGQEPCRFKDTSPKWLLAPNRYSIVDKDAIDQLSKKVVSLRGPYDLFTGRRDGAVKNHFNTSLRCSAATWPIALKGSFDTYKKTNFGKMNKTNNSVPYRGRNGLVNLAMRLQIPNDPGPAHYNVEKKVFVRNKCGFNSSYDKPPGYKRPVVWPGVGRYEVDKPTCGITGHGHRHVFLSKLRRTNGYYPRKPMNTF